MRYKSFNDFYPYYLSEHSQRGTKLFHFIGTLLVLILLLLSISFNNFVYLLLVPIFGYGLAWAGHFFIEKNNCLMCNLKDGVDQVPFKNKMEY